MATSWIAGMPQIIASTLTETTVQASGSLNQEGIIAMVIVPAASGEPSAAQIYAGQDSDGNSLAPQYKDDKYVSASGVYVVLDGGPFLSPGTAYTMWVVGNGLINGLMAAGSGLNFTTYQASESESASESKSESASESASESVSASKSESASSSLSQSASESVSASKSASASTSAGAAPNWITGYPAVGSITVNSAVASFKIDDVGSGYFVVVPAGASAPSAAQVKAGTDADDVAIAAGLKGTTALVANTVATKAITSMHYSTNYVGYFVAEDQFGQATDPAVETVSFRAAVPRPGVVGRYSMRRITRDRQRLANQITNTLRGM